MRVRSAAVAVLAVVGLLATGCSGADQTEADSTATSEEASAPASASSEDGGTDTGELSRAVIEGYAEGVHASYEASLASATEMDAAIAAFIEDPSDETLQAAKDAWLTARDDYGPTEAFRFYGGPIDDEEDGVEGLVNAWPLDEAYIDYVDGQPEAGIVNDPEEYPEITAEVLTEANEQGGEANVSSGWHAIEFLLWGQDSSEDGAGERPASDYTDADNADRRATYLATASDLLLVHLQGLVDAWAPDDGSNYRAEFVALPDDEALTMIATGIGELSRGELAGERMSVAYFDRSEEDEHSCFSDNTTADIVANAEGIRRVIAGEYPGGVDVTGFAELVGSQDADLGDALIEDAEAAVAAAEAIPAPFDQHLRTDIPDDDPGRESVLAAIEVLEAQTDTIVTGADALGLAPAVS